MKKFYFVLLCLLGISVSLFSQPNVLNPADPEIVFSPSYKPSAPAFSQISKWGHTKGLAWDSYLAGYKCYYFKGTAFRIKFPKTYQPNVADGKKYPVFIFFSGLGEKGDIWDNEASLLHGAQFHAQNANSGAFDGFLVYPQSQSGYYDPQFGPTSNLIDSLVKYVKADQDRVILSGLSAGGQGVWNMAANYYQDFAGLIPISAARPEDTAYFNNYITIPVFTANGGLDKNPYPESATTVFNAFKRLGGNLRQIYYPTQGHSVWNTFWSEPGYFTYLKSLHKANPLVYYGSRTDICPGDPINVQLGVQAGFYAYEWQKDSVTIAGATSNTLAVTQYGVYRVHFKRTSTSDWSDWSPTPVAIRVKQVTATPAVQIQGLRSNVLPAPDGSTTTPLMEPGGYKAYEWRRVSDNALLSDSSSYPSAVPGQYTAKVTEQYSCGNPTISPVYTVVNANGMNVPDKITNLVGTAVSTTSIRLDWNDNPNAVYNETLFEIYRATTSGGPYKLAGTTTTNKVTFTDINLTSNTIYYYIVRPVNGNGAAPVSAEAATITLLDKQAPTAPESLKLLATDNKSISLYWNPSKDNVGVAKYLIYVNGAKSYMVTTNQFTINNLTANSSYTIYVVAQDLSGNLSAKSNQITAGARLSGLSYKYYEGTWSVLPSFNLLTPVDMGMSSNTDISKKKRASNYAFLWTGYIKIPVAGSYTFETYSSDGSKLYMNVPYYSFGTTALVSNDGTHAGQSQSASYNFTKAGTYPVVFTYFNAAPTSEVMSLYWTSTAAGIARSPIPDSAFADKTPAGAAPLAPDTFTAQPLSYSRISLSWNDKSSNETGFEVFRSLNQSGPFTTIATVAANTTAYTDSACTASTTYYYKVRAINDNGGSDYAVSNAVTNAAPAAPVTPSSLTATATSGTSVRLQWTDSSTNETGFDIWRTPSTAMPYRLIASVPANNTMQAVYIDSGLFANATYYYKVIAKGEIANSGYSNVSSAKTINSAPAMNAVSDVSMRYGSQKTVTLSATDADRDNITFSTGTLPAFATLTSNTNGTATLLFNNPSSAQQGVYSIQATAADKFGGKSSRTFNLTVNSNYEPVVDSIPATIVAEGQTGAIQLHVTDQNGISGLQWSAANLPSFATLTNNQDGTATVQLAPYYASSGNYNFSVTATDALGAANTKSSSITVTEKDPLAGFNDGTAPLLPSGFAATAQSDGSVKLSWKDIAYNEKRYDVYRATDSTATFTLVNPNAVNANDTTYVDKSAPGNTTYYYKIVAVNDQGNSGYTPCRAATTANKAPLLTAISNVYIKGNNSAAVNFAATDDPGEVLKVTITNLPSFAAYTSTGNGAGQLVFTPGQNNIGAYNNITITVKDNYGGSVTQTFNVLVNDKNTRSVYVNVGSEAGTPATKPWNNLLSYTFSNLTLNNLIDENETATGYNFTINGQFAGRFTGGMLTGNNSGIYPDDVLNSGYYENSTTTKSFQFTGLNAAKKYNVVVMSSINSSIEAKATFTSGSQSVVLNGKFNNKQAAQLNGLVPDVNGAITVSMTKDNASYWAILNAVVLEEYDSATQLLNPVNLEAESDSANRVKLMWSDRTTNESGYTIWRSTSASGTYTQLAVVNPNVTTYFDSRTTPNTKYYYKVSAVNGAANSEFSNVANCIITNYSIHLNFEMGNSRAPFPWVNTSMQLVEGGVKPNLVNNVGNNTGFSLAMISHFNDTHLLGVNTGNNSGIYPDLVMQSTMWIDANQTASYKLTGLDQSMAYRLRFFGSWTNGSPIDYTTTYNVNGQRVYLNCYNNSTKAVYIDGIRPDENGEIRVDVYAPATSYYGMQSALVLEYYSPSLLVEPGTPTVNSTSLKSSLRPAADLTSITLPDNTIRLYPNPFKQQLSLQYSLKEDAKISVQMYDLSGRMIYRRDISAAKGFHNESLNFSNTNVLKGAYLLRVLKDGVDYKTFKVIKN